MTGDDGINLLRRFWYGIKPAMICRRGVSEMGSKLVTAKAENPPLSTDSTKRRADFSKERPPIHLSYPIASPAPAFRCKIDAKYPLTSQNSQPILPPRKRKFLSIINHFQITFGFSRSHQRPRQEAMAEAIRMPSLAASSRA